VEIKQSTLSKVVVLVAVIVLVLVGGFWAVRMGGLPFLAQPTATPTPTEVPEGRDAAITSAMAFLSMDVTEGREAWIARLCDLSGGEDTNGCAYAQIMAEVYWPSVEQGKVRTGYEAQNAVLVRDFEDGRQVWKVSGVATNLNTGETKNGEFYVAVVRDGDTWRFDHILLPQEVEALEANP
jgi:hypothetical protein